MIEAFEIRKRAHYRYPAYLEGKWGAVSYVKESIPAHFCTVRWREKFGEKNPFQEFTAL